MRMTIDWPEVSRSGAPHYSDEYIEWCAQRYAKDPVASNGMSFEHYLAVRHEYDNAGNSATPLPLLARQQRVQQQVTAELIAWHIYKALRGTGRLRRNDAGMFEPLRHHRHRRTSLSNFTLRRIR